MRRSRDGATLVELVVTVAIVAAVLAIALPPLHDLRDRASVRAATADLSMVLATARHSAVLQGRIVAARFDTARVAVTLVADTATLAVHRLGVHGVTLSATRDSIAYGPTGLGYGASTTTIHLRRGRAVDTITVSRLGRVRH
ncbi:MAG TPA: GspH/FimT family pseudopilin [Gemmatimonadaceae bacterium]|nr:GspH/FimT family pseudopilin [Gemmatimonadaceae bacterium]